MALFKSAEEIHSEKLQEFLIDGETIEHVYSLVVDFVALTNKRIIFVDQSVFSKETAVITIPFSKIEKIGLQKDKRWALSDKVEITTRNDKHELKLLKGGLEFYNKLAKHIC